jgi:hypothetical protein
MPFAMDWMDVKKKRKKKKRFENDTLEAYSKIRKPLPPSSRVITPKGQYDRKDKSWTKEVNQQGDNDE